MSAPAVERGDRPTPAPIPAPRGSLPDAVLWDMDGTLVDTEPYWIATEYELVERFGDGSWNDEKAHSMVGFDLRDSARVIQREGGVTLEVDDIVNRLLDGVIAKVKRKIPWRPGARELLAALQRDGVPCALVTMSWRRFAEAVVEALPDGSFVAVITGDEVTHGKPHPEPYLRAAQVLGVLPGRCVAIEDSPTGVRSAVAAGCHVIAVPNVLDVPAGEGFRRVASLTKLKPHTLLPRPSAGTFARRRLVVGAALAAVAAIVVGVVVSRDDTPPPPPAPDIAIEAWVPYWQLPEATATMNERPNWFRSLSPFWYAASGPTAIAPDANAPADATAAFIAAAKAHRIPLIPSVNDVMPSGGMAAVLADSTTRAQHVDALVALAEKNDFAGLDLDYEVFPFQDPKGTWEDTRKNFSTFVEELATRLHAQGRTLSVTVPPILEDGKVGDVGYWVFDYHAIAEHADQIRVMAYDYSTSEAGPIAPLAYVQQAIDAAKRAVDDDSKIILGIALYGRNWPVSTTGTCPTSEDSGRTGVDQRTIDDLLARRGGTPVHDPETGEASFTYELTLDDGTTSCTQTREVHYVDAIGTRERADLARRERIGGVSMFALGDDSAAMWAEMGTIVRTTDSTTTVTTT